VIEQAQGALARLWEISTRKGMSPLVVNALGRSLRHLDGVRVADQDDYRARYLKLALIEMRTSMGLMENSANRTDRQQLGGLADLVSSLVPLEAWADATLGAQSDHPTRPGHEAAAGASDDQAVGGLIGRLGSAYRQRAASLADPQLRFSELAALDLGIAETVRALEHLRERAFRWVDDHPARAAAEPDDLAAFAVSIHLGDEKRIEQALPYLEAIARPGGPLAEAAAVLGAPERAAVDGPLHRFWGSTTDPLVRAALVPLLTERRKLSTADLTRLLEKDDEPPAVAAAEMLAWVGGREQVVELLEQGRTARSLIRAHSSLFAALALGSLAALDEIRRRLDVGEGSVRLIEGLAIAGDEGDVRRLLLVAARRGRLAHNAALAAGHLGSVQIATARGLSNHLLEDALGWTFGSSTVPGAGVQSGRLWQGRPWSIGQALLALAAGETPVRVRERLALEIGVRTGARPPTLYRADSAADVQTRAAQAWQAHWSGTPPNPGPWAYYGASRPHRRKE
jgi:hypothetical protein